jgi:hypothetical protein
LTEELKELKMGMVAFEGNFPLSKLFDKTIQEAIEREVGVQLVVPMILFEYGEKKFILIMYSGPEDYKKGKAIIAGLNIEDVKQFYGTLSKILISPQK